MSRASFDEMQAALGEVIPALMAAGASRDELRAISDETLRRMPDGGSIHEWLDAMLRVIGERFGRKSTEARMFKLACFRYYSASVGSEEPE